MERWLYWDTERVRDGETGRPRVMEIGSGRRETERETFGRLGDPVFL